MKYMFEVPEGWDLKECFIKIDHDENIIIDNPIDHNDYSRATVKLEPVLTDDIDIQGVLIALDRLIKHHPNQRLTFLGPYGLFSCRLKDILVYEYGEAGIIFDAN